MQRTLFIMTLIACASAGTRCMGSSMPSTLQGGVDVGSGIKGTTRSLLVSGVPGGPTTGGPASLEFAVAPVEADKPAYARAIFVTSDAQGVFAMALRPGTYWIGSKAKALDPLRYVPDSVVFSETVVVVKEGAYVSVELTLTGYAP
jgi:hypothetical protein